MSPHDFRDATPAGNPDNGAALATTATADNQNQKRGFPCQTCGKVFERPDLQRKHHRRCIKSFGIARQSKKKSCDSCAKSKLKCDLQTPSCSRCSSKKVACVYQASQPPTSAASTDPSVSDGSMLPLGTAHTSEPLPLEWTDTTIPAPLQDHALSNEIDSLLADPMLFGEWTSPPASSITGPGPTLRARSTLEWDNALEPHGLTGNLDTSLPDLVMNDMAQLNDDRVPQDLSTDGSSYANNSSSHELTSHSSSRSSLQSGREGSQLKQPQGLTRDQQDVSRPVPGLAPMISTDESTNWHEDSAITSHSDNHDPLTALNSISETTFLQHRPDRILPNLSASIASPVEQSSVGLLPLDAIQKVLMSYPRDFLDSSFKSPVFHFSLMRSASTQMLEPLAVALCCIAAHSVAEEASLAFICNTFQDQRTKLANGFNPRAHFEHIAAVLHAFSCLQVESLLRRPAPKRLSIAELHHPLLLKMTRSACKENMRILFEPYPESIDWRTWIGIESFRRTVIFVHILTETCRLNGCLHPEYRESLDEDLMLKMPLPAPESLWTAANSTEWAVARQNLPVCTPPTLGDALKGLTQSNTVGLCHTLRQLWSQGALVRLSISCAAHGLISR